jgi:predicted nicotinamide N-methyase
MEFEFENIDTKITLRAKSKISQSTGLALWIVRGKRVLELGSGLGLCGILSHLLGASEVIATDGDLDVLRNLRYNMNENRMCNDSILSCPQLIWGQGLNTFEYVYSKQSVILATDVFYSPHLIDPLWYTVDKLLEPDGIFLLGFCRRNVTINQVLDKAEDLGFKWTRPNIAEGEDDGDEYFSNISSFEYFVFVFERKQ